MKSFSQAYALTEAFAVRYIKLVFVLVAVLVWLSLRGCLKRETSPFALPQPTDTVRVAKKAVIKAIPKPEHWPVAIVTIYEKDTVLRAEAEKKDIILTGKVENKQVELTTIAPNGEVKLFTFNIPDIPSIITFDNGGIKVVEDKKAKRKSVAKKIGNKVLIGAALVGSFFLGRAI